MNIIEKHDGRLLYYQFEAFRDIEYIDHLFTTRIGWDNSNIRDNISRIFNIPKSNIINTKQVHGIDIIVVDSYMGSFRNHIDKEADGLITHIPNLLLTTSHADCVPIYILDRKKRIIGLAHGGWRGTYNNISGKMIEKFENIYGSKGIDILVGIGPSIGACCYEIGEDLFELFKIRYTHLTDILIQKNDRFFLDLWKLNCYQMMDRGIPKENIILSRACTSCNVDKFYSHRKEKGTKKRLIAAIGLKRNAQI